MRHFRISIAALIFVSLNGTAIAKDQDDIDCARILNAKDRLACYDKLIPQPPAPRRSYLTLAWNLDKQTEDDRNFNMGRLRTYRQNYFIVTSTDHPNLQPYSPLTDHQVLTPFDYDHSEAKFQLSFKADMWDQTFSQRFAGIENVRMWLGYTQQSHWQIFNTRNSSPFRETNYEPELIATFGTGSSNGLKLVNLGVAHQSNGQSNPLSRSWNRIYMQGGWEWDRWQNSVSILARAWYRLPETSATDDNPDILFYLGRGDIVLRWEPEDKTQAISLLMRNNLSTTENRGYFQLDWSLPHSMGNSARTHLQFSSGYGESLIDYNYRQTIIGLGLSFREW